MVVAKKNTSQKSSTSKVTVGVDKHKLWGIAGLVFFILVIALLVGYPLMKGKKGAVGQAGDPGDIPKTILKINDTILKINDTILKINDDFGDLPKMKKVDLKENCTSQAQCDNSKYIYCDIYPKSVRSKKGTCLGWYDYVCTKDDECLTGFYCKTGTCAPNVEVNCADSKDDDKDGDVDCLDRDCVKDTACVKSSIPSSLTAPTNLQVENNTKGVTTVTLKWDAVDGATNYQIRANDGNASFNADAANQHKDSDCAKGTHYLCKNNDITTNSFTMIVIPGHTYTWWMHAVVGGKVSDAANGGSFSVEKGDEGVKENSLSVCTPIGNIDTYEASKSVLDAEDVNTLKYVLKVLAKEGSSECGTEGKAPCETYTSDGYYICKNGVVFYETGKTCGKVSCADVKGYGTVTLIGDIDTYVDQSTNGKGVLDAEDVNTLKYVLKVQAKEEKSECGTDGKAPCETYTSDGYYICKNGVVFYEAGKIC